MKLTGKTIIFLLVTFLTAFTSSAFAQVKWIKLGVNGLTCSACSRTVEMSIRKLPFVKDVEMNLEHTEGKIFLKENTEIDFTKISKSVTDAGFSVRQLSVFYNFTNLSVKNGYCFSAGNYNFQFLTNSENKLNGETELKLKGVEFMPKSEFNKIKTQLVATCSDKIKKTYFVMP